ncbi:MAG: choice-of-anchor D domain-containing protein [Bacteroidota bacterium]
MQASHNQFTGSIPASIGNLTNLLLLSLESNQLTGSIPHEIGNLTQVYGLYLQQNQLSGNIPAEIGNLTGLRTLFLFNNQLTGSIPHEIGNLTLLTNFVAYNNQLSGSLPDEIGNLTALTTLSFYNNNLAGNLPSSLGNLTDLIDLALSDNDLDGPIPSTLGNLTSLDELDLSNNKLTGSIPASLSNLKVARYLVLNDNKLTGAIPAGFGTLPALQYLSLESNQLTDLPDLSTDTNIWHLSLYDNGFTFEDLEPNVSISGISYLPQNITLATPADQNLTEGDDFNIAFAVGGTMNQYVWWKNGYSIAGANQSTFDISSVVIGDAGSYSLTITNSKVPGLFFNTDPVKLSVSAKPAPVIRVERSGVELVNNTGLIFADTTTGSVEEIRFSILNTGNAPLIVSSITAGGDFEVSIATATIAAGDSVSVSCYYKPTKDGQSTSSLIITNNTSLPTFSLTLKGNSFTRKPILSVVNSISFPLTTVGSASIQELSLSNTGDAPLVIYNFKPTGDFATAVSTPITILPNETESVSIQFWPSTEGTLSGSLAISSNADSVAAVVLLTGTGFIQQQPQIDKTYKLTVSNIAQFGNVEVGNDQVNEISLTNSGNTTINIEKIEVTGAFLLVTDFSGPLAAGEVLKIQVAFNPNNIGEHTGTITIISDSDTPTITLNLVGEGVADIEVYNFVSTRVNGKNDFLAIKNITQFPGNIVQIFDRWGNRVYSKSGYNNDDETFRGIDERGKTLPEGTYYYKIDKNNGSEPVLGFLLLRN